MDIITALKNVPDAMRLAEELDKNDGSGKWVRSLLFRGGIASQLEHTKWTIGVTIDDINSDDDITKLYYSLLDDDAPADEVSDVEDLIESLKIALQFCENVEYLISVNREWAK